MTLHLVLVEPAGPLNVGSVARLCANFGIDQLRLVSPRCDPLAEEARRMAVRGLHHLETAPIFASLSAAIADCGRVVATSGRQEGSPLELQSPARALGWLNATSASPPGPPSALVFGREDRGLSNDELLQAGRLLRIPTSGPQPSLNLSHAVAIVLHALQDSHPQGEDVAPVVSIGAAAGPGDPCVRGELEAALADATDLLLEVGYLLPHSARARMAKVRGLLQRAQVSGPEVALLRGMVCQLRWASRRVSPPGDAI